MSDKKLIQAIEEHAKEHGDERTIKVLCRSMAVAAQTIGSFEVTDEQYEVQIEVTVFSRSEREKT